VGQNVDFDSFNMATLVDVVVSCQTRLMRLSFSPLFFSLLLIGCAHAPVINKAPSEVTTGDWVHFYFRDFSTGERLDYFYDASKISQKLGHVIARWKVVGTPQNDTTLYGIDIACAAGTFTETGTILTNAQGRSKAVLRSELLQDYAIESGTSSDVFSKKFCPE
jgi:hypothetical protein